MKILGLDLGSKTLGIAISDALGLTAQGIETYNFNENQYNDAIKRVRDITQNEKIEKIILGYPKNMNGTIGERGKISENFGKKLEEELDIKVILWDERMSTLQAEKILIDANMSRQKRKKVIDKMAAVVILQSYLNSIKWGERKMDENYLRVVDEEENEILCEILFTFDSDEFEKSYVFYIPVETPEDEEIEVLCSAYKAEEDGSIGQLSPVENDEEWEMIEEVFNTYMSNMEDEDFDDDEKE